MSLLRPLVLFSLLVPTVLFSQEIKNINPVIKIVAGEPFYVHEVLKGQKLDDIARAYASNIVAIQKENPSLTDPLILGINIRIPYTDASAARMVEVAEEMELVETSEERLARENKRQAKAKEEAKKLIVTKLAKRPESTVSDAAPNEDAEENVSEVIADVPVKEETAVAVPEVVPEEESEITTEELALLKELTDSVSESLEELEVVKEEIEDTPYLDKDGLPKREPLRLKEPTEKVEAKETSLVDLIAEVTQAFQDGDSLSYLNNLFMREYFLVRVNPKGIITNVRDERTMTNANTRVLQTEDLKGRYLVDNSDQFALQIVPVGLNVHLERHRYPVKVKNGKLKPLKPGITEDALSEDGNHFAFISASPVIDGLKGKYVIELVDGNHYLSIHDQFEYNPFGVTLEEVAKGDIMTIVDMKER
ncbi:MAG: hypothetical protein RLP15_11690 [Cryomorphaceae bacterium]